MITRKRFLFLKSLRVLYEYENLERLCAAERFDYITVISGTPIPEHSLPPLPFRLTKKSLANIPLEAPPERTLAKFNETTRNEIRKSFRIANLAVRFPDKNRKEHYALYRKFEYAQGRVPLREADFENTVLFGAYLDERLVASMAFYELFPCLKIKTISSVHPLLSPRDHEMRKLVGIASRRIVYEAASYALARGYTTLSLSSVNFDDPKKANIARFKMGFGTVLEDEYTYTYKSPRFSFLETFIKLRVAAKRAVASLFSLFYG